jgi:ABC-type lipoprotein release transport system permease subunit
MPLVLRGVKGTVARKSAMQVLNILEMGDRARHKPSQLSGGQQQRVAIARALVSSPDIILVDEPTGNLDVPTGKEILELLRGINSRLKRTVILVTHNPDFVSYGDRVLYMEDGRITKEQKGSKSKAAEVDDEKEEKTCGSGRMSVWETVRMSRIHFLSKGLRTFLTTLGVALGVASIIALVSLGIGLQEITKNQLASLNMLVSIGVSANRDSTNQIDDGAVSKITKTKNVVMVSPGLSTASKMTIGNSTGQVVLQGIKPEALEFEGVTLEAGDAYSNNSGIVISRGAAKNFNTKDPDSLVGEEVTLDLVSLPNGSNDLTKAKTASLEAKITGVSSDDSVSSAFISLDVLKRALSADSYSSLKVEVNDRKNVEAVQSEIENMGFVTSSVVDLIQRVDKVFLITQVALGIIGSVALLVALIGIVNIMTVALLERTHEVGVLKAVGATDADIRRIFLYEVAFYGLIGAVLGTLLAIVFGESVNSIICYLMKASAISGSIRLFETPLSFALEMIVLTVLVSLLGGWYPSKRASRLSPAEALRYE